VIKNICFATDPSLGKLCKWLRVLGFDTRYGHDSSTGRRIDLMEEKRCLLTRITALKDIPRDAGLLFIRSNDPFEQLKQVIDETGISIADLRPLSRCIRCNLPLSAIDKPSVFGRVPDYVWATAQSFRQCPQCRRIYWRGSHSRRIHHRINQLFNNHCTGKSHGSKRMEYD